MNFIFEKRTLFGKKKREREENKNMEVDSPRSSSRIAFQKGEDLIDLLSSMRKNRQKYGQIFIKGLEKVQKKTFK